MYALLTLRAVKEDGVLDMSELDMYVSVGVLPDAYQTDIGDVVVRLTWPYSAILVDEQSAGLLVSSHFVIIRLTSSSIGCVLMSVPTACLIHCCGVRRPRV